MLLFPWQGENVLSLAPEFKTPVAKLETLLTGCPVEGNAFLHPMG